MNVQLFLPCNRSGCKQAALFQANGKRPLSNPASWITILTVAFSPLPSSHLSFTLFTTADPIIVSVTYSLRYWRLHQSTTAANSLAVRSPLWGMCVLRCARAFMGVHLLVWHNRIYSRNARHPYSSSWSAYTLLYLAWVWLLSFCPPSTVPYWEIHHSWKPFISGSVGRSPCSNTEMQYLGKCP
jgi:hypothetical protein